MIISMGTKHYVDKKDLFHWLIWANKNNGNMYFIGISRINHINFLDVYPFEIKPLHVKL